MNNNKAFKKFIKSYEKYIRSKKRAEKLKANLKKAENQYRYLIGDLLMKWAEGDKGKVRAFLQETVLQGIEDLVIDEKRGAKVESELSSENHNANGSDDSTNNTEDARIKIVQLKRRQSRYRRPGVASWKRVRP